MILMSTREDRAKLRETKRQRLDLDERLNRVRLKSVPIALRLQEQGGRIKIPLPTWGIVFKRLLFEMIGSEPFWDQLDITYQGKTDTQSVTIVSNFDSRRLPARKLVWID